MIRKLLRRVFKRTEATSSAELAIIPVDRHGLRREQLSPAARKVCAVLQERGYKAYVVGGAVRDLLAGLTPKDFDVATSATPEQVRESFRRSRIIGRRFKIVHVMSGPETIEVSTFRAGQDAESTETDEHGRILRDNVFGNQQEDATRRDFTVNALYYDPSDETIHDYHHGVADLQQKTLRIIGDPRTRYREDPVRMLRAVRLGAKLGLSIDPDARKPIREMAMLIDNVPPARLFDEMLKLLFSGHAVTCLKQLREEGLHHGLLPLLDVILEQPLGERFVWLSLENTDQRVRQGKPVSPGFLFATLLWHEVLAAWESRKADGEAIYPALFAAMDQVLDQQAGKLAITRRIAGDIKDIWALQPRFEKRSGKAPYRVIEQPRYRAGWDFLRLRAESGELPMELADWWERFSHAGHDERAALLQPDSDAPRKRRRKRRKSPAAGATPGASGE
ncbi:polynucleotide adenylyltransferase PcnB [Cognatazoarcus halotolerans]|uniref:polynucleotide adenylyltransferase PcnB n=1 Tax=Cognatazoarcus halotolerans TaxID=2686016 RepID=UPI0013596255|nr:polynucleotide adenylyltransferase PcnB [Cognatazoarcus halotolerans]MBX3680686.1 polynucleotide adenylyltransferase PcnB [Rhodocyclaceae bacterium]MCB1901916.1 polynucleotide adenylyltransferase PcnB [Rhodocyclaceae bacterium]MCP5310990.1 polynucleotide adenylyltransferase PcnB [Zoogloeaceae bacterium]